MKKYMFFLLALSVTANVAAYRVRVYNNTSVPIKVKVALVLCKDVTINKLLSRSVANINVKKCCTKKVKVSAKGKKSDTFHPPKILGMSCRSNKVYVVERGDELFTK